MCPQLGHRKIATTLHNTQLLWPFMKLCYKFQFHGVTFNNWFLEDNQLCSELLYKDFLQNKQRAFCLQRYQNSLYHVYKQWILCRGVSFHAALVIMFSIVILHVMEKVQLLLHVYIYRGPISNFDRPCSVFNELCDFSNVLPIP